MGESLTIEDKIRQIHENDEEQLNIIFDNDSRLLVEAPAGYGKTKTMISKLAYILAKGKLMYPKKILALTFSVNAAFKMRKDVNTVIPDLLSDEPVRIKNINRKVFISNYHGFCRSILKKYGYLLNEKLSTIYTLRSIDDTKGKLSKLFLGLSEEEIKHIGELNDEIKNKNIDYLLENMDFYVDKVINVFLPNDYIPFNAILILVLVIFNKYPETLKFYQSYFPYIIVDEFQDTNILSWELLQMLISKRQHLILMGDSLQRIYGFIGAIPDLLNIAEKEMTLKKVYLKTNHRFADNNNLLLLDNNLRKIAENPSDPVIDKNIYINIYSAKDQNQEAKWVYNKIMELKEKDKGSKIAILVKQRSKNTDKILDVLNDSKLDYFNALFSDEDVNYKNFHNICADKFYQLISSYNGRFDGIIKNKFMDEVSYLKNQDQIYHDLYYLLDSFIDEILNKFSFLDVQGKVELIKEVLENGSLKQQIEYINKDIIISTIHGAKGLEWDYVILPDMEQYSFPYKGLCGVCNFHCNKIVDNRCNIDWHGGDINYAFYTKFLEELSVFYVAVTRARKQVFFSYSNERIDNDNLRKPSYMSCLMNLDGIIALNV